MVTTAVKRVKRSPKQWLRLLSPGSIFKFIGEAIRRAEAKGYYPADCQRAVNWDMVAEWARAVQLLGFRWLPVSQQSGTEFIIVGRNGAITSGQHRILGGLMGGNPVPEESITRISPLPTQSWRWSSPAT